MHLFINIYKIERKDEREKRKRKLDSKRVREKRRKRKEGNRKVATSLCPLQHRTMTRNQNVQSHNDFKANNQVKNNNTMTKNRMFTDVTTRKQIFNVLIEGIHKIFFVL